MDPIFPQDAAAVAEQDAGTLRREMEKVRRRHATEVATLQQRVLESRLHKTAVCPMCLMAERVKFQFTEVDAETAQDAFEAEVAVNGGQEWMDLQMQDALPDNQHKPDEHSPEVHDLSVEHHLQGGAIWTNNVDEQGRCDCRHEFDENDELDHIFMRR